MNLYIRLFSAFGYLFIGYNIARMAWPMANDWIDQAYVVMGVTSIFITGVTVAFREIHK